jgi:hypothetical protein
MIIVLIQKKVKIGNKLLSKLKLRIQILSMKMKLSFKEIIQLDLLTILRYIVVEIKKIHSHKWKEK